MKKFITMLLVAATAVAVLAGCGKKEESSVKDDVKVEDITAAVKEALGDDYWPTESLKDSEAAALYGITMDNCDELIADMPLIGTNADLLIVAKAKSDKLDAVKTEIEALRESKVADTMQYPMNIQKIAASKVTVIGNYVIYVQLGGDAVDLETDEAIKAGCEEDNNAAITAIETLLKK